MTGNLLRPLGVCLLLLAEAASAKPWNGIEPGASTRDQVLAKFGEPSKEITAKGQLLIAYLDQKAIRGTTQAQFKLNATSKVVERIDVFPKPVIDKDTIEKTYGKECPEGREPEKPCYLKKLSED